MSVEQLRKQAKDLLRAARSGDAAALQRVGSREPKLAHAQHRIAHENGFASWPQLVHHLQPVSTQAGLAPLIRPIELRTGLPYTLPDGTIVTTDDVFGMFVAARNGDLDVVKRAIARAPALAVVEYNYTPPIHFAVREGHLAIVEILIRQGADVGSYRSYPMADALLTIAEDHEHSDVAALLRKHLAQRFALASGTKEIIAAARAGDLARVRAELARDPALARASNETGDTALHHAAQGLHVAVVDALLEAGADPDAVRGDGYRPIQLALMRNFLVGGPENQGMVIADRLAARGARYTMHIAALRGDHQFIRDALARDRSRANEEDTNHHRPLSAAARRNDAELVRLLLDHGADPNLPEEGAPRGHALWTAAHNGALEIARMLVQHGADPNAMVESSGTPMGQAVRHPEIFALLAAHGGITGPRTPVDKLGQLIGDRRYNEVERMVRDAPALLHHENWGGEGVLMGPASMPDHEMLALLMRLGARVPLVTKWAPYYYFKHERTAAFLLEHGMDPNHMNWHRLTLLHHTAMKGELAKVKLLVDHGADIDAIDEEYRSTPLAVAVREGQWEVVEFLLDRGADPNLSGAPWATPLAWARKRGHAALSGLLRDAGAQE